MADTGAVDIAVAAPVAEELVAEAAPVVVAADAAEQAVALVARRIVARSLAAQYFPESAAAVLLEVSSG